MNRLVAGAIAGAAGTTALNVVTNLDMVVRGRPSSEVPQRTVEPVAEDVGLVGDGPHDGPDANRLTGLGAVSGALTGVAAGIGCALVRPRFARLPAPLAALAVGLGAMAVTDASATVAGATDPRSWSVSSWLADVVPHVLFGWATVAVVDLLSPQP